MDMKECPEKSCIPELGRCTELETMCDIVKSGGTMHDVLNVASSYKSLASPNLMFQHLEPARQAKTRVVWIHGPSGCGKTRTAVARLTEMYGQTPYMKNTDIKWWHGYDGDKGVVFDGVEGRKSYAILKVLCGSHPVKVKAKGGSRQFRAETMYITSLYHPAALFGAELCVFGNKLCGGRDLLMLLDEIITPDASMGDGRVWSAAPLDSPKNKRRVGGKGRAGAEVGSP